MEAAARKLELNWHVPFCMAKGIPVSHASLKSPRDSRERPEVL